MHLSVVVSIVLAACFAFGVAQGAPQETTVERTTEKPADSAFRPINGIIELNIQPSQILFYKGMVFVASWHDKQILSFDTETGKQLAKFDAFDRFERLDSDGKVLVGSSRPGSMAVAKDRLFVNQTFGSSILVINVRTLKELTRIEIDQPSQGRVVAAPDENVIYFASNIERAFYAFDPFCTWLKRTPYPDGGHGIGAVVVSQDSKRLYLGIQRGASDDSAEPPSQLAGHVNPLDQQYGGPMLAIYDIEEKGYIASKSIGDTMLERGVDSSIPSGMAFGNDEKSLLISMRQCTVGVHVLEIKESSLQKPIAFSPPTELDQIRGCNDVVVHDDHAFVALASKDVVEVVDSATRKIERTIDCGGQVSNMAVHKRKLYACQTTQKRILVFDTQKHQ